MENTVTDEREGSGENKMSWVSVFTHSTTGYEEAWMDAIVESWAVMCEEGSGSAVMNAVQKDTVLKVAVIIGLWVDESKLEEIIWEHELSFWGPECSVRYFVLSKKGNKPDYEHDKIRVIHLSNIAPNELPDAINISLYKARLPPFLRKGYNVEICEETLENKGVIYRKIRL